MNFIIVWASYWKFICWTSNFRENIKTHPEFSYEFWVSLRPSRALAGEGSDLSTSCWICSKCRSAQRPAGAFRSLCSRIVWIDRVRFSRGTLACRPDDVSVWAPWPGTRRSPARAVWAYYSPCDEIERWHVSSWTLLATRCSCLWAGRRSVPPRTIRSAFWITPDGEKRANG